MRSATVRSVFTQWRRSSRNSGWKTASRSARSKAGLPPELVGRGGLSLMPSGSPYGTEQALRVFRGPKQMCRFQNTGQFGGRNQGHVLRTFSADDNHFLIVDDAVENRRELFAKLRIRGFDGHGSYCTGFLYVIEVKCPPRWSAPGSGFNRSAIPRCYNSLRMSNVIVLGAQWGDEGKGKVVDLFAERFDIDHLPLAF